MSRAFPATITCTTLPNSVQKFDLIKVRNEGRERDEVAREISRNRCIFTKKRNRQQPALIFPCGTTSTRCTRHSHDLDGKAVIGPRSCTCPVHVVSHGGIAIKVGVATPSRNTRVKHTLMPRTLKLTSATSPQHVRPSSPSPSPLPLP